MGEVPRLMADVPRLLGEVPRAVAGFPQLMAGVRRVMGDFPQAVENGIRDAAGMIGSQENSRRRAAEAAGRGGQSAGAGGPDFWPAGRWLLACRDDRVMVSGQDSG